MIAERVDGIRAACVLRMRCRLACRLFPNLLGYYVLVVGEKG